MLSSPQRGIKVLVGDVFDLTLSDVDGPVDAVFDRAALVGRHSLRDCTPLHLECQYCFILYPHAPMKTCCMTDVVPLLSAVLSVNLTLFHFCNLRLKGGNEKTPACL